jgi:hypothetical protein
VQYKIKIMKKNFYFILILFLSGSCDPDDFSHSKFYDYIVLNQLPTQVVKIVPLTNTDFWITRADTFTVTAGERIIIGTKSIYDDNEKIVDIYMHADTIAQFELFIDGIKQKKDFTKRASWSFSFGSVDESGFYTLVLNDSTVSSN